MQGEASNIFSLRLKPQTQPEDSFRPTVGSLDRGLTWLVHLRWIACVSLFIVTWLSSRVLGLLPAPLPLYLSGVFLCGYNILFQMVARNGRERLGEKGMAAVLTLQITLDLVVLTVLLYFSGISHNPFIIYYVFHIIIAGILLSEWIAYLEAVLASLMVGALLLFQHLGLVPEHGLNIAHPSAGEPGSGAFMLGTFIALTSALLCSAYFTVSVLKGLRAAEGAIRQRERFASLGQFVSGIIHQVRNPLDGIRNCLHHIRDNNAGQGDCNRFIRLMNDELDRMERLTFRLQDFARPHGIELQPVDVNREITAALHLLGIAAGDGIDIRTELETVPPAHGDPFALQEVIINLCTNAIAAMPQGGRLTVRSRVPQRRSGGSGVGIEVADTGRGLRREELGLIFEPFYTTRPGNEGTGLGLWICQTLVSQMGGRIEVESTPGSGSTFRVLLQTV